MTDHAHPDLEQRIARLESLAEANVFGHMEARPTPPATDDAAVDAFSNPGKANAEIARLHNCLHISGEMYKAKAAELEQARRDLAIVAAQRDAARDAALEKDKAALERRAAVKDEIAALHDTIAQLARELEQARRERDMELGQHAITKDKAREFERYADNAQAKYDAAIARAEKLAGLLREWVHAASVNDAPPFDETEAALAARKEGGA